ncbi:MAG: diguanylate cyclase, partial [Bacteroidales bacterium]
RPLSLVFMRIEHRNGGAVPVEVTDGDPVARVLQTVRKTLRGADIMFAHGSGEFVILLAQTDRDAAAGIAQRLGETIAAALHEKEQSMHVRIGFATYPADGLSLNELVERATQQLTAAMIGRTLQPPVIH